MFHGRKHDIQKTVGGSSANIAVACSQYQLKAGFIGRVSDDQHGRYIRKFFETKGIDTTHLIDDKDGGMNGLAFTEIMSAENSSYILHRDKVAGLNLGIEEIDESYIKQSKLLVISGTALSKSPSRDAVFAALEYAEKNGCKVLLDIDYRNYTWKSEEESGIYLSLAAEKSHIIIGTREEYDMLVNMTDCVQKASSGERIVPGFNVFGFEDARAVIDAVKSTGYDGYYSGEILCHKLWAADLIDIASDTLSRMKKYF